MTPAVLIEEALEGDVGPKKEYEQNQGHPLWFFPAEKGSKTFCIWKDGFLCSISLK